MYASGTSPCCSRPTLSSTPPEHNTTTAGRHNTLLTLVWPGDTQYSAATIWTHHHRSRPPGVHHRRGKWASEKKKNHHTHYCYSSRFSRFSFNVDTRRSGSTRSVVVRASSCGVNSLFLKVPKIRKLFCLVSFVRPSMGGVFPLLVVIIAYCWSFFWWCCFYYCCWVLRWKKKVAPVQKCESISWTEEFCSAGRCWLVCRTRASPPRKKKSVVSAVEISEKLSEFRFVLFACFICSSESQIPALLPVGAVCASHFTPRSCGAAPHSRAPKKWERVSWAPS